jgi:dicarboxylate/amino acid:cation (Na+ or H+) symporter, DAACS family
MDKPEQERDRAALPMHWRIAIGLFVGLVTGLIARALMGNSSQLEWIAKNIAEPIGQVFLRLILMVVIPLVFSSLVLGIAGIGDPRRLGKIGLRTFGMTLVFSVLSVVIGIVIANVVRPGDALDKDQQAAIAAKFQGDAQSKVENAKKAKSLRDSLLDIIPKNPFQEMVGALDGSSPGNGILSVMFFALIVGVAVSMTPDASRPFVALMESVFQVCMTIIGWAMWIAPFGVAGLIFSMTALLGVGILQSLAWYVFAVLLGLGFQLFVVYSLFLFAIAKMKPTFFLKQCSEAILTAFSTSSSNATLPTALRVAEENLKLRPGTSRFVLTVGSTANQNGTALYEGVTVLFLAQVFGVDLSIGQQVTVLLLSVLAGIGTAGVPGGSLPAIVLVLQTIGVPGDGIGIILGVDRLLDMCRTTLNVTGDLAVAACVDRMEGERDGSQPD